MLPRSRIAIIVFLLATGACRYSVPGLDDAQKLAYGVKPAVVRISALATAKFRYRGTTVLALQEMLHRNGYDFVAQNVPGDEGRVDTGAGGSGSGFVIHPNGLILTSGHVVAATRDSAALQRELRHNGAIAALLKHFAVEDLRKLHHGDTLDRYVDLLGAAGTLESVTTVNEVELSNGDKSPFKIEQYSPALPQGGADLALLSVKRKDLPVVRLGDSDAMRIGDSIWSIGYPAVASSGDEVIGGWLSGDSDLEATTNPGSITAIKRDVTNTPVFQSNVAIYHGNSGGPAVNHEGEVIAISSWGHTDAEQIKFLVPVNVAKAFLASAKVPLNVDGDFSRHYRAALDAAAEGRWPHASAELAAATQLFPKSPDLIRFRADVDRKVRSMPLWRQHPAATGAIAFAVVGIGAFAAFPIARRNRPPRDLGVVTTVETIVSPNGTGAATALLGKFTILNGSRAGERLGLGGSGIRIGRESTICEIVLENPKVSRLHAEVVSIDGKVLLIDRNSSNGTYVNDQKIDKRFLKDGDIIYFGGRNAVAVAFHA